MQITDSDGRILIGATEMQNAEYYLHEFSREEDELQIGEYFFYVSIVSKIEDKSIPDILHATET